MKRARIINTIGFIATGTVLLIVLVTKFLAGAWIAILAMGSLFVLMKAINRHYSTVSRERLPRRRSAARSCFPAATTRWCWCRTCTCRPCGRWPTRGATRPDVLEALTVDVDDEETRKLNAEWGERRQRAAQDRRLAYREITARRRLHQADQQGVAPHGGHRVHPRIRRGPLVGQLLHNQSALRLKTRLLFIPNVMMTSVPWQLNSSIRVRQLEEQSAPGDVRRGFAEDPGRTGRAGAGRRAPANGGSCVARHDGGWCSFTRYALPGSGSGRGSPARAVPTGMPRPSRSRTVAGPDRAAVPGRRCGRRRLLRSGLRRPEAARRLKVRWWPISLRAW